MYTEQNQNEPWQNEVASDLNKLTELMQICAGVETHPTADEFKQYALPLMNIISRVVDFEGIESDSVSKH